MWTQISCQLTTTELHISCVPETQCDGFFNVRQDDDLVCEDASLICCHEDQVKEQEDNGPEQCSKFAKEGYR